MKSHETAKTIICTIDKDLDCVPGWHYNFVKKQKYWITEKRALRNFYEQLLIGDASDNVKGVIGIGKVKAPLLLEGCETEQEMFDTVRSLYNNDKEMLLNGQLLWLWRDIGGTWNPEQLKQEAGVL